VVSRFVTQATRQKKLLKLHNQPTTLRRCLQCDCWMRSTGPDHRICNACKGVERQKKLLKLHNQPTTLRRCLQCDCWMRSTGPDHRICNACKGVDTRGRDVGSRLEDNTRPRRHREHGIVDALG